MRNVVIVGAARTPIGKFMGALASVSAPDLGVTALRGALDKSGLSADQLEEVVAGHCGQASAPGNSARWISVHSGCPDETVAMTVNQQCPSSMRATEVIAQEIMLGKIDIGAAVGCESMSNAPYLLYGARKGYRLFDGEIVKDSLMQGGLMCPFEKYHMGVTAENIAEQYNISRQEQDEYAYRSHQRAGKAIAEGLFRNEIVPVQIKSKKGMTMWDLDEHPQPESTMEEVSKLAPFFKKDGTVTAYNASGMNDAGSALLLMAEEKAQALGIKPLARIVATASGSVAPSIMGMGVVPAVQRALKFAGMEIEEIDYWEINEAFAAQLLGVNRELHIAEENLNAVGSGISLGHPVGATGARLVVTMLGEMRRRGVRYGCASLCASGGPACAIIIENLQ